MIDYSWKYFWGIWKLCVTHAQVKTPHTFYDHLRLWEFSDTGARRLTYQDSYE